MHPPGPDRDHRAAGGGRRLCGLPGRGQRLAAPAPVPLVRLRRLLRRLAEQARERARGRPTTRYPLARAGRGLVLVLRGRDRDADPADHGEDEDSALADAVALNSAAATVSTRPSLRGGPVTCTAMGIPSRRTRPGTAHVGSPRGPAAPCRQHVVAEALRVDVAPLRWDRDDRGDEHVGGGEHLREARADAFALGGRLRVLRERDLPCLVDARGDVLAESARRVGKSRRASPASPFCIVA